MTRQKAIGNKTLANKTDYILVSFINFPLQIFRIHNLNTGGGLVRQFQDYESGKFGNAARR